MTLKEYGELEKAYEAHRAHILENTKKANDTKKDADNYSKKVNAFFQFFKCKSTRLNKFSSFFGNANMGFARFQQTFLFKKFNNISLIKWGICVYDFFRKHIRITKISKRDVVNTVSAVFFTVEYLFENHNLIQIYQPL